MLALAVLPPLYLLYRIYKIDSIEREPAGLLFKLFVFGILSLIPAAILEGTAERFIMGGILSGLSGIPWLIADNFLCVALIEECCKYIFLKKGSWNDRNFDYIFDAVVYAVVVSLGFATVENILYVFQHGMQVALLRAVTAIPGHCIFGIFMGHYYGQAKAFQNRGMPAKSKAMLSKSIIVPVFLHGFYDFTASMDDMMMTISFFVFIIIMDVTAIRAVRRYADSDSRI